MIGAPSGMRKGHLYLKKKLFIVLLVMLLCLPMEAMANSYPGFELKGIQYTHSCSNPATITRLHIVDLDKDVSSNSIRIAVQLGIQCTACGRNWVKTSIHHTRTVEYSCDGPTENYFSIENWDGKDKLELKLTIPATHLMVQKYDESAHWKECGKCGGDKKDIAEHTMEAGEGYDYCTKCDYVVYPDPVLPETGDGANLPLWVSMLAVSVIGIMALPRKRKSY